MKINFGKNVFFLFINLKRMEKSTYFQNNNNNLPKVLILKNSRKSIFPCSNLLFNIFYKFFHINFFYNLYISRFEFNNVSLFQIFKGTIRNIIDKVNYNIHIINLTSNIIFVVSKIVLHYTNSLRSKRRP